MTKSEPKILFALFGVSFLLTMAGWLSVQFLDSKTGEFIIHWNNLGIDWIGDKSSFSAIGLIGLWSVGLNFLLFIELRKKDEFLSNLIAFSTFFVSVLIFAVFMAIISVN